MTEQYSRDIIDHINPEEGDDVFEERKLCRSEASGMPLLLFPCGGDDKNRYMSLSELLRYHPEALEYVNNHHDSLEEVFNNGKVGKR